MKYEIKPESMTEDISVVNVEAVSVHIIMNYKRDQRMNL